MNRKRFREVAPQYVCKEGQWAGPSVWNAICEAFPLYGDFSHPQVVKATSDACASAYELISIWGDKPCGNSTVVRILLLLITTASPFGQSPLIPVGVERIGNALHAADIKVLLQPLDITKTFERMREDGALAKKARASLQKKQRKAVGQRRKETRKANAKALAKSHGSTAPSKKSGQTKARKESHSSMVEALKKRYQEKAKAQQTCSDLQDLDQFDRMGDLETLGDAEGSESILQHLYTTAAHLMQKDSSKKDT